MSDWTEGCPRCGVGLEGTTICCDELEKALGALATARQAARDFYHCAIDYRGDRASVLAQQYRAVLEGD